MTTLTLPFPPSLNRYWRSVGGRTILSQVGRTYRKRGLKALAEQQGQGWPSSDRVAVSLTLCAPDRRKRDVDNYVKAVLDLLTHGGVYGDDSQVDRLEVTRGPVEKGGRVVVEVVAL